MAKVLELQLKPQSFQWIFRIDFPLGLTGLISVQSKGLTLKNLLQCHSSKASILRCSAFFMVQLSRPFMTTRKTIALTVWTFVSKVMSLLFNMLPQSVIGFFLRSKHLLITNCSDFGAQENKVCHCFHHFPIYLPRIDGTGCHDFSFLNVEF